MAEELETSLLNKKDYYENCPGCKVDLHKAGQTGLPIKELFTVWVVILSAALPISSLFPFVYFMIRDFHIAKREEDISTYAGYVGSAFMLGRALTSVLWGTVADRYGRKPVIVFGTFVVVIFNTLFGLSVNFWMAVITRFLLGFLNGLMGPIRAYAAEIFREEYQAMGMSTISSAWGIGLIIGPAIGGFFAQPAEKYPAAFSKDSIFGRFPYFLPCLCISLFSLVVGIASIWLPVNLYDYVDDFCVYGTCCFCQILFAVIQLVFHLRRKLEIQYVGSLHIVVCLSFFFLLVLVAYNMLKECKLRLNW